MSQFVEGSNKGYVATAALADGIIVKLASGNVVVSAAATNKFIGVTVGAIAAGETGTIRLRSTAGTLKVKTGGTIAVGDRVTSDAAGKAVATTTAADEVLGMALEAGVTGDFIEVMPSLTLYAIS